MDDEDNQYELDRQRIIAENRALLDSLGFEEGRGGSAVLGIEKQVKLAKPRAGSAASSVNGAASKKRKSAAGNDEGPRRRSGRIAGIEATAEQVEERVKEEEKQLEQIRVISRKIRDQVMPVDKMMDEASPEDGASLKIHLSHVAPYQRRLVQSTDTAADAYAEPFRRSKDVDELKSHFKSMHLRANPRVTPERVYCMAVHPDPTRTLVCAGDKHGVVGMWDALGQPEEPTYDDDNTAAKGNGKHPDGDDFEGRVWQIQAHARSSVSCMKFDPVGAGKLFTSSYDCTLRSLDLSTGTSTELLTLNSDPDDDILINHFDVAPNGNEIWLSDRFGGITHLDIREPHGSRTRARRWVVQDEGRGGKLGGMSVNPLLPHIIATAGNDQHLRIWDVRQLHSLAPKSAEIITVAPPRRRIPTPEPIPMPATPERDIDTVKAEIEVNPETIEIKQETTPRSTRTRRANGTNGTVPASSAPSTPRSSRKVKAEPLSVKREEKDDVDSDWLNTHLSASIPVSRVQAHMEKGDGKALHRAAWQHGKSCSAAYWDPWGRRVLTTSYDDKLRVFNVDPSVFDSSDPIPTFKPTTVIPHNCQTGRWLTILRAQWSLNTDVAPFFTIGNMKRTLDVVAGTGEKICSLWTDAVTAVPAVTAAHPGRIDHVFGANTSGKVQLWTSAKSL